MNYFFDIDINTMIAILAIIVEILIYFASKK